MLYAALFFVLGGLTVAGGAALGSPLAGALVSASWFALAASHAFLGPRLFGKRDGRLALRAYPLFAAYLLLNNVLIYHAVRLLRRDPAHHEIVPGLHLGRRLTAAEAVPFAGVLDLTCEFPECAPYRTSPGYLELPVLDGSAPTEAQLRAGVAHIAERLEEGPVYVHCAMGHRRSATFVAAYMLRTGQAADVDEAEAACRRKRPRVRLNPLQRRALDRYNRAQEV